MESWVKLLELVGENQKYYAVQDPCRKKHTAHRVLCGW